MIISIRDKSYIFEFGLIGLMMLRDSIKINVENNFLSVLYCGLIKYQPNITMEEVNQIFQELDEETKLSLISNAKTQIPITEMEVAELYRKAVGEVGIQPSDFYSMSRDEIEWAYEGYLRKKESEANLCVTAIKWAQSRTPDLIRLTEDKGYEIGSIKEREDTFKNLGIEV